MTFSGVEKARKKWATARQACTLALLSSFSTHLQRVKGSKGDVTAWDQCLNACMVQPFVALLSRLRTPLQKL